MVVSRTVVLPDPPPPVAVPVGDVLVARGLGTPGGWMLALPRLGTLIVSMQTYSQRLDKRNPECSIHHLDQHRSSSCH